MTPEELKDGLNLLARIIDQWYVDYCGPDSVNADLHKAEEIIAALRGMWVVGYADPNSIAAMLSDEYSMITIERSTEYREDVPLYTLEPPT